MNGFLTRCLLIVAAGLAGVSAVRADEFDFARGPLELAPAGAPETTVRLRRIDARRLAAARAAAVARPAAPAVRGRQPRSLWPVSWGPRIGSLSANSAAAYGQYATPNAPPDAAAVAPFDNAVQAAPMTTTINPYKYAYAGRSYAEGCASPVYNSGYYASGCFRSNACCRASRRLCTPFGGASRGCTPGCYIAQTPPCPTTCADTGAYYPPNSYPSTGGATLPRAGSAPTPIPSTTSPPPPAPGNLSAPPQPIEKRVTPEPQASNFPRIPGLPPDA